VRASFKDGQVQPFTLSVPDSVLTDLKERLARTRFPETEPKAEPWRYGTKLAYMRDVVAHWRDSYDWRKWEARINAFSHYKTTIGCNAVHFILERGSGDNPMPLLITHGWPGSFVEFLNIIERLAHPERFGGDVRDAFTVVAPSLPGYGFSDPPDAPMGPREIAPIWSTLMTDVLGCERYVAQGGDWGSIVTSWLALDHPKNLAAIHLNMLGLRPFDPARHLRLSADPGHQAADAGLRPDRFSRRTCRLDPREISRLDDPRQGCGAAIRSRPVADQHHVVLDRRHQRDQLDLRFDRRRHIGRLEAGRVRAGADGRAAVSQRPLPACAGELDQTKL
jgi:pimeloyl-ACP methyl ester carboxylesterase